MEKWECLFHLLVTVFLFGNAGMMAAPAITDVTMAALCPGKDECSLAIYLSGFQQAVIGVGTLLLMPVMGNLSDRYGRKALLTLPMTLSILPLVILAYSRTTGFFYAYYVLRTLTGMVCEGSVHCLALAYLADNIAERQRASAFGVLSGVASASLVSGTLAARLLSPARAFQVAAVASMLATVYMRIFLKESPCGDDSFAQPILKTGLDNAEPDANPVKNVAFKKIPSPADLICLLRSSTIFSQAAIVVFFTSLSEGGLQASLMYFLKARFHFNKDQFADMILIIGLAGTVSQLILMPILAPAVGEAKLLSLSLFVGCMNMVLCSLAWAAWVPYVVAGFFLFVVFATPCIRSIASKQVGPSEQGKVQGCISGVSSFANIISPFVFSPLTALFLSDRAPFNFPGFSILCLAIGFMTAFFQSIMIKVAPASTNIVNNICTIA